MKPIVSEYFNEEKLVQDINQLISKGIEKDKIYVISHDQDRTKRIAEKADSNTIGLQEMVIDDLVGTFFESKGDELRTKMKEIVLSEREAKTL
ncbi:general stress protein [Bacillus sp. DJP31]|uniref:general stress protein n=1 Tax=Bacillus sp. DJP31 TaxID=3409789 RepID=UPI003BB4D6F4